MRRAARIDRNQHEIVSALRAAGARVQHLHTLGGGCPDILVGYRGRIYLMEIKSPGGSLTPDEEAWQADWSPIAGDAIAIVRSADDALRAIGAL